MTNEKAKSDSIGPHGAPSLLLAASFLDAQVSQRRDASIIRGVSTPSLPGPREGGSRLGTTLRPDNTIGDILHHPAFAGFAPNILPWDDHTYDQNLELRNIGSLLPYHSHVEPVVVVDGLNRMIADTAADQIIFYDIYSDKQKQAQPSKEHTGLFFFRGRPDAPFAIIAPGGGFAYVGSIHEGFPYAKRISELGYNAFVLKYRAGRGGRTATEDLAAAISFIFRNASKLGIMTNHYALCGSSAGARMAAQIGSHGVAAFGGDELPKPSTVVMAYTAHSDISSDEPPTFAVAGKLDDIAPPSAMARRVAALRQAGTPVEYHVYEGLGHGFGTGSSTPAEGWLDEAIRFWQRFMVAPKETR